MKKDCYVKIISAHMGNDLWTWLFSIINEIPISFDSPYRP
jgi:hypothetical protein